MRKDELPNHTQVHIIDSIQEGKARIVRYLQDKRQSLISRVKLIDLLLEAGEPERQPG